MQRIEQNTEQIEILSEINSVSNTNKQANNNEIELDEERDTLLPNDFRSLSQYLHSMRVYHEIGAPMEHRSSFNLNTHGSNNPTDVQNILNETNKRIIINIGGIRFETYKNTLNLIEESRLANLTETNSDYDPINNEYFFDRDPYSFQAILNYFRTGKLHAPGHICGNLFYEELEFWGINEQSIQPCCWTKYSVMRDCDEILNDVMDHIDEPEEKENLIKNFILKIKEEDRYDSDEDYDKVPVNRPKHLQKNHDIEIRRIQRERTRRSWIYRTSKRYYNRYRPFIWRFLDDRTSSLSALIFFWLSVLILAVSIISFVLSTNSHFRVPYEIATNKSLTRKERESKTVPHPILNNIELACNLFFACEFVIRFLSSPNKLKFLKNPYNIFEFLAILPILLPAESQENKFTWQANLHGRIDCFYILRILRIFTIVPKYSGLRVLLLTFKNSLGELILYFLMLLMAIMIFASFIFYAEQIFELDDNKFDSILISLWWAIVTMTTLGYGDIVPVTPFGYIVGGLCALSGCVFLALPIPVIVNNFTTYYAHAKARQKLKENSDSKQINQKVIARHIDVNSNVKHLTNMKNSKLSLNCVPNDQSVLLKWDNCSRRRDRRSAVIAN